MAGHISMPSYLTKRNGIWQFKRRVPSEFAAFDPRAFVKESTGVRVGSDRAGVRASDAADRINKTVEAFWRRLANGERPEAAAMDYETARKAAKQLGFRYLPVDELANTSAAEIISRLDRISAVPASDQPAAVTALLGGVPKMDIRLSQLADEYEKIVKTDIRDLSPDQLRRWRNQKNRAVATLIEVIGDKWVTAITRDDAMEYRQWWQNRIVTDDLNSLTANKNMGRVDAMLRQVELQKRLGITPLFSGLRFGAPEEEERQAYDPDFVQSRLLAPDALSGLNDEARNAVYFMADTGMRPVEIVNLVRSRIVLDAKIPHVQVRPDDRRMKTPQSRRDIPLVGFALLAARLQPDGFPRYRDQSSSLSATVNKFLEENGLRPTDKHTLYSLRHTFEDRLTEVEAPEKLIANLMGHKYTRPRYGKGAGLAQKQKWLLKIAFKVPKIVK